ncbi:hypothetical protein ABZ154_17485 [Streptomyces sp. NPDC006261]|uniref:hypothetical protein n=1 Tax=Streptomyces sp. NPDC006261 TaxID=3156739 RepID=UPI00339FB89E
MQAEGGTLVVAAEPEPAEPGSRLVVLTQVGALRAAAQFAHPHHRGRHVVDPEEEVRAAAEDAPCPLEAPIA